MLELVIRLVFSLAVVLGLLALVAKIAARRFRGGQDALVQVVHRQQISRGAAVSVVTVGSKVLVLGTTEQQVRVLTELDPAELDQDLTPGEVLTLLPAAGDLADGSAPTFELPAAPRPAGAHRAAPASAKGGRRATRPAPEPRGEAGALAGSLLSSTTWKQAFAAASRRAS